MAEEEKTGPEAEAARLEAEARRKRIMEKSKARYEKVSGLQQEADAEDQETKTSSAARMQAMRRRRFKKGKKAKEEAAKEEGETKSEEAAQPAAATTKAPEAEEPKKEAATPTETPKAEPKVEEATTTAKTEAAAAAAMSTAEDTTAKKKYKGVAKMRREKMLQKKKEDAEKAAEEEAKNPTSEHSAVQARRKKRTKQPILPILMYLLTTMLLFLAGLDVGLQHADESILVNREFAPNSFSLQKLNPWGGKSAPIKDLGSDTDTYSRSLSEESDEFSTAKEDVVDPDYIPNIDPLFRVDLDQLTKGPGVLNQLGRGAVKVHRMILFFLWELPLQVFALPAQLFSYPPVLCLTALTIRQVLGKLILGAKLPEAIEEDVRNTKEITDVLTMIKNAVKNTVVSLFPTAVSLYEGFQFLKADMYVMLCGVFVGLLISTWSLSPEAGLISPVGMDAVVPDQVAADGLADEL